MADRPNLLFVFADQLRAKSLPLYGENQIETPNLDRLASEGVLFTNAISSCPVCTPYRSMLLTGRHPQTTGHVVNFVRTRHDEISIGDAFGHAGYRTGWVGKWHLHTGSFPAMFGVDYVPEGRDRLGFEYWRAYNFHADYFNGWIHSNDWHAEQWEGYETDALNRYALEFVEDCGDEPFCLFVSAHQPHFTGGKFAPQEYFDRLPKHLDLPPNVYEDYREDALEAYPKYLAMTLALDDMVGELMDFLEKKGLAENTILIFTSDHGTQMGAQHWHPFHKKVPYEETVLVPMIARWPGVMDGGRKCDTLMSPVDIFPSLCTLCGVPIPRTVEGYDLSDAWRGRANAFERDAILTLNFSAMHDYLKDGEEWRGVRTRDYSYAKWLKGEVALYDLKDDQWEMNNLAGQKDSADLQRQMEDLMEDLLKERNDQLLPCNHYASWLDNQRRIVRNVYGPLRDPEAEPDWSLLE